MVHTGSLSLTSETMMMTDTIAASLSGTVEEADETRNAYLDKKSYHTSFDMRTHKLYIP